MSARYALHNVCSKFFSLPINSWLLAIIVLFDSSLPTREDGSLNLDLVPEVGNGHLAHVPFSDTVQMNGLYNGVADLSHRARIPAFVAFNFTISAFRLDYSHANITYALNLDKGKNRCRYN